jgi:hypothetical protein
LSAARLAFIVFKRSRGEAASLALIMMRTADDFSAPNARTHQRFVGTTQIMSVPPVRRRSILSC